MNIFSKIKELIFKKNERNKKEGKKMFIPPAPKLLREDKINMTRRIRDCKICGQQILQNQAMRKEPGTCFYFHTLCIKEAKKFLGF